MKKILLIITLILPIIFSCKKEGCTDAVAINYDEQAQKDDGSCNYEEFENSLPLNVTNDLTLTNDKIWYLVGRTTVSNGATLTIEPGTIIKGISGTGPNSTCLLIARGSKINAQGTQQQPIIFTSIADNIQIGEYNGTSLSEITNGLWGGLIICGNAPISADTDAVQIEGIPASDQNGLYGGFNELDNSGILSYVSIRHGGTNIGEGNEINGLTLGGVGAGTIINNIEIVGNQDDGIECFGGNVNVTNLLVWSVGDDCVDIDQSYNGTITNVLIIPGTTTDHVLEIDGGEGQWNIPFNLYNCEIISDLSQVHFRAGAEGYVSYYGNINIQADLGTNVVTEQLTNGVDQNLFNWTYWYNH